MSPRPAPFIIAAATFGVGLFVGRAIPRATPPVTAAHAPTDAGPATAAPRRVRMPAELRQRAGVRAVVIQRRPLAPTLELVGAVEFDGDRVAEVGSRTAGRVARIMVRPGSIVRAGDPLVEVESTAVADVAAAYSAARAGVAEAQAEHDRLALLAQQQLATAREIEQNRAALQSRQAEVARATQQLLAMGLSPDEVRRMATGRVHRVTLRAPIAGKVLDRPVVLGQVVEPAATLLRIGDLSRLWVQLQVFERDLARVRIGDRAEVESEAYPERVFSGQVGHVASSLDAQTRTARVRIEVDNRDELLRPGQFVTARVRSSAADAPRVLSLPRSAIVQLEGQPAAFVEVGEGEYEQRFLQLGAVDGNAVVVTRGVDEGERVVVAGAFSLKSELQR